MNEVPYRSWVEVSRARIAENFRAVRELVGPGVEVAPVVKADGYRHGAVEVSRVLEADGAGWLAVSSIEEAVALRQAGRSSRILVMADFLPAEREAIFEFDLTPVLHGLEDIGELEAASAARQKPVAYHLKVDSGMGRLGTRAGAGEIAVRELRPHYRAIYPLLIISTLAPLLGLFGTVVGLMEAFENFRLLGETGDPSIFAGSISKALITTIVGLAIAMPALATYHFFKTKTNKLGDLLETEVSDLIDDWLVAEEED